MWNLIKKEKYKTKFEENILIIHNQQNHKIK
jgi:hypothetical protein